MSDEESFVILGSSPLPSLELDGIDGRESKNSSLQSDRPGSRFSSLKNSQITELQSAREISTQTPTPPCVMQQSAECKLWSRPPVVDIKDDFLPISLGDCALKSPLEKSLNDKKVESLKESLKHVTISAPSSLDTPQNSIHHSGLNTATSHKSTPMTSINNHLSSSYIMAENNVDLLSKSQNSENTNGKKPTSLSSNKSTPTSTFVNNNLASSFIMGDVNADVLKTSVYSQFPSISMEACAEDVVKLQNMVVEYMDLKNTLDKVNNTMKLFYNNSMQTKEKMNQMENHYKEQLDECQKQIEMLRKENQELKHSFESQIEHTKALDVARQKDREETIQVISEKNALLENMRAQIVKLEQQQLASFEFLPKKSSDTNKEDNFDKVYVSRGEYDLKVKDLQRELSEMLASNLDMKDIEKQYLNELDCLKVNLTAAEEMLKQHRAEIAELRALDMDRQKKILDLEKTINDLRITNAEQSERITLLEQQNEVHRTDFEMERECRETVVGEKQQILQDLRILQKKNQDLIEEHQKMVQNYEKKMSTASNVGATGSSIITAAAAAQTYIDNPQRPIRALPSQNPNQLNSPPAPIYCCPVCNKAFKSLSVLQSHVNECIDKN